MFAAFPKQIQSLYFWDLAGTAIGSALVIPLISLIGPGGLLFFVAGFSLIASALFINIKRWTLIVCAISSVLFIVPIAYSPHYFDFKEHQGKRDFDGGSQTSLFYPFDGEFGTLRENLPNGLTNHIWQRGVLVSHYFKEGTHPNVLVIGSAGGQEIKAALMYGAGHVEWGFKITLLLACVFYALAFWVFSRILSVLQYGY